MSKGQQAVAMRDAGLSNAQIATTLNMTKDSVRRLISETRKSSRKAADRVWLPDGTVLMQEFALDLKARTERAWAFTGRKATHLIIPDTQCKPGVPLEHLEWAGRYAAERKPDVIIHLGDHWDMPSLSSYEKKGSRYFEGRRVKEDIEVGNEGLRLFEKGLGGWQPKRKILLRGNHEDRITRAINEDPKAEGLFGFTDFNDVELGWEIIDYLVPVEVGGITYSHYFYRNGSGTPFGGAIDTMLRNIGFSFTMGHQQGLRWGRRELPNGHVQIGLVAGSYYQHNEDYRGPQAAAEWRGLVVKFEVAEGNYDPLFVSMDYLRNRYGA